MAFCRFSLWMPARELHANASTTLPSDTRSACYRRKHSYLVLVLCHLKKTITRHTKAVNCTTYDLLYMLRNYFELPWAGSTWYCGIRARWLVWLLSNVKTSNTPTQFTRNLHRRNNNFIISFCASVWKTHMVVAKKKKKEASFEHALPLLMYLQSTVLSALSWKLKCYFTLPFMVCVLTGCHQPHSSTYAEFSLCVYLVLPVMRILLGSMTRQAKPAVWMVRSAELSWTM